MSRRGTVLTAVLGASLAAGGPAFSGEGAPAPSLSLELNGLEAVDAGCRLTFVVTNGLGAPLGRAAFEIVLFDTRGLVDRLTVLDFKDLPAGKTKVRQFDLPQADCAGFGRVLVNDAIACEGDGIEAGACMRGLVTATRASIEFGS